MQAQERRAFRIAQHLADEAVLAAAELDQMLDHALEHRMPRALDQEVALQLDQRRQHPHLTTRALAELAGIGRELLGGRIRRDACRGLGRGRA